MLVSHVAVVGLVTLGLFYASLKLTKWSLNAEKEQLGANYIEHLSGLYRTALFVIFLLAFGSDIGAWLISAFGFIMRVIL